MRSISILFICLVALSRGNAQLNVVTYRYDNARTGANLNETTLTPASVASGFGKLYSRPLDGSVYAQPLYVSNVAIPGNGTHNVVYVATMNDTVYAFDADSNTGANASPLWTVSFINPAAGITPVPVTDIATGGNISGGAGIESTPVIDLATKTIYVLARTKENGAYLQRLHALDISSGAERPNSPRTVAGSIAGTGYGSVAGKLSFDPELHNQRAGLAMMNNQIVVAWASHEDVGLYHGWVMTFNKTTLAQTGIFCTTPNGSQGGIWMSGWAPAVDSGSNAYVVVGNGVWDGRRNFGESVLKLNSSERLAAVDFFTPFDWDTLNSVDADLGVTGFMLIPGSPNGVAIGKKSKLYLVNTQHLGWTAFNDAEIPQTFDFHTLNASASHGKGGPAYWSRPGGTSMLFMQVQRDFVRGFPVLQPGGPNTSVTLNTAAADIVTSANAAPVNGGGVLVISGDPAGQSAILWSSTTYSDSADTTVVRGILRALDAGNGLTEIWNSETNPDRDSAGNWAKFVPPLVANGHVYLATFSNQLNVYGLLP